MRVFHASGMKEMEKEKKKWKRFYLVNSYNYYSTSYGIYIKLKTI